MADAKSVYTIDDLEDEENTGTEGLRIKLKRWVYGTFMKAMQKKWNALMNQQN